MTCLDLKEWMREESLEFYFEILYTATFLRIDLLKIKKRKNVVCIAFV